MKVVIQHMKQVSVELKKIGQQLNQQLSNEFNKLGTGVKPRNADELYWLAVVYGASWAIGGMSSVDRFKYVQHVYNSTKNPSQRGNRRFLRQVAVSIPGFKGTRKKVVVDVLYFHACMLKSVARANQILRDPVKYEELIIDNVWGFPGAAGHWSATVPFKVLAVAGVFPKNTKLNELQTPLGSNVRRGLKELFGISINEGRKFDLKVAQQLHRHLAELVGTNIFHINSGLWKLGQYVA